MNDYRKISREIGTLLNKKQQAYGNSFNEIPQVLRLMYPRGLRPDEFDNILCIARILDKLWRIARNNDPFGESPWKDIAGYALLAEQRARSKEAGRVKDSLRRV